eukprot:365438-Chlamydomonas_euryale.AAC.5
MACPASSRPALAEPRPLGVIAHVPFRLRLFCCCGFERWRARAAAAAAASGARVGNRSSHLDSVRTRHPRARPSARIRALFPASALGATRGGILRLAPGRRRDGVRRGRAKRAARASVRRRGGKSMRGREGGRDGPLPRRHCPEARRLRRDGPLAPTAVASA